MEKEIQEIIKLNNLELIGMIKEYLLLYLQSLIQASHDKENRKVLISSLKEYIKTIKTENFYMHNILNNVSTIQNKDLNDVLDLLDYTHETTYHYYEKILCEYQHNLEVNRLERKIKSPKDFKAIEEYKNLILGLSLTQDDLDNYYSKEEAYEYLKKNTKIIEEDTREAMRFYGCYPLIEDNILKNIKICVPKITNLKTMLINIHEYKHGICMYPYLYKEISINTDKYEQIAKQEEETFKEKFLKKSIKKTNLTNNKIRRKNYGRKI